MPSVSAIVLCGSVGAGKTVLSQALVNALNLEYYGIDDYRGHKSMKDFTCHRELMADLWKAESLVLECTGAGRFFPQYLSVLHKRNYQITLVRLRCPHHICKQRIKGRSQSTFSLSSYDFIESVLDKKRFDLCLDTSTIPIAAQVNAVVHAFNSSRNI